MPVGARLRPRQREAARDRRSRHQPGARRRAAHRRRLRRGLRRGQALVVGHARRRQGRGAHAPAATAAPASGSSSATPPASPTPPTSPRRAAPPRPRRPRPRPAAAAAAPAPSPSPARTAPAAQRRSRSTRRTSPRPRKVELLTRADEVARGAGRRHHARSSASYGDSRRRILVANSDGLLAERRPGAHAVLGVVRGHRRHRHADRPRVASATPSASSCSTSTTSRSWPAGPPTGPSPSWRPARRPVGADAGRHRLRRRRRAVPRGVRPRARGRPRRQGRLGVRGPRRRAGGRRRWSPSSTTAPWPASGAASPSTTRATPPQRNVLIEDGVLTDYMWDLLRARKEGRPRSGNGRRQSYQHLPMVRMTNTYLLDGPDDPDDDRGRRTDTGVYVEAPRRRPGQHRHRRLRVRHDRGVPHRGRRDHRAAPRGQPHRQRPRGARTTSTPSATTSPWARPARAARTARACPSATASRPCGCRPHHRRHRRMTRRTCSSTSATGSSPWRGPGEQVEAVRRPRARHRDQGLRAARSSRCRRPSPRASASG